MTIPYTIRQATFEDLPTIAAIHVVSWQHAYVGQMPQKFLDELSVAARLEKWQQHFPVPGGHQYLYVACCDDKILGFLSCGASRNKRFEGAAEIYAVYLLRDVWGQGIGHSLFKTAAQTLRKDKFIKAYLWALSTNQSALDAYKLWGGVLDRTLIQEDDIGSQKLISFAVLFDLNR